jgi:predicted Zn-dependent protease
MSNQTNKQILNEILKEQKEQAKKQFQLAADFSVFMNKIEGLLYSDSDTNSEGYIEKQNNNSDRILSLEIKNKVTAGKVAISIVILSIIGGFVWKVIGLVE